MLFQEL